MKYVILKTVIISVIYDSKYIRLQSYFINDLKDEIINAESKKQLVINANITKTYTH